MSLKPSVRAVEISSAEYCPPAAIGLMRDTAGAIATLFAHGQAFGQDCGKIDHRRDIIDRDTVRTNARHSCCGPPGRVDSAGPAVRSHSAVR